ncbi:hypothetical protein [Vreelandella maris]|uniref:Uncharacterized protein n=1 Tax=Vreelandella maris TaxID=2729617 RepID=A0A7Y6RG26_9GAMM|nr:hypothetical protein [Halomonas maris]NVF16293.1 hypothetical protein [Halomonas maris]
MRNNVQTISAYSVVNDVIPKLNAVERLVEGTVKEIVETSRLPAEIERYSKLQIEFQLEISMIRMNLEHLFNRYHGELTAVKQNEKNDSQLILDSYETTAIESAKTLYRRVQELQQAQ